MKCRICGKEFTNGSYSGEYEEICSDECFGVAFWDEVVSEKDKHLFINGKAFYKGENLTEGEDKRFAGFGGHVFKVKMKGSNKILLFNNLWERGEIPESHKKKLKDNAEFVKVN